MSVLLGVLHTVNNIISYIKIYFSSSLRIYCTYWVRLFTTSWCCLLEKLWMCVLFNFLLNYLSVHGHQYSWNELSWYSLSPYTVLWTEVYWTLCYIQFNSFNPPVFPRQRFCGLRDSLLLTQCDLSFNSHTMIFFPPAHLQNILCSQLSSPIHVYILTAPLLCFGHFNLYLLIPFAHKVNRSWR